MVKPGRLEIICVCQDALEEYDKNRERGVVKDTPGERRGKPMRSTQQPMKYTTTTTSYYKRDIGAPRHNTNICSNQKLSSSEEFRRGK